MGGSIMKSKKKKNKLTLEQKKAKLEKLKEKKLQVQFDNSVKLIFMNSGFEFLNTNGIKVNISSRPDCEFDLCFVHENIIIVCETTIGQKDRFHMLKKQEAASAVLKDNNTKLEFLNFLSMNFTEQFCLKKFDKNRWRIFFLYFSKNDTEISDEDKARYDKLIFVEQSVYNYFITMSKCIKKSFKYELFRYLELKVKDYGPISAGVGDPLPKRPISIIYPDTVTGLNNGVGVVSFMMSPNELIKTSYVLRKDNWEDTANLYQRLVTQKRIKNIRKFVLDNQRTFFNNVIVGLPDTVAFFKNENEKIDYSEIENYENCSMTITEDFNSVSIIDGQHRVYAYYENDKEDENEKLIKNLRNKHNLLVTGLIFPKDWSYYKKVQFQSEIFLEINKNSKNVDKDLLIHIESIKDPLSSLSISRNILKILNKSDPFKNKFQLSLVESANIKVASLMQFALGPLVNPKIESEGLYKYWVPKNGKQRPNEINEEFLDEYIKFCAKVIQDYFKAIKCVYNKEWDDPTSRILMILSINGFIIALHHSLKITNGVRDFDFYKETFSRSKIDFTREKFSYSGSKYHQFATEKIITLFS